MFTILVTAPLTNISLPAKFQVGPFFKGFQDWQHCLICGQDGGQVTADLDNHVQCGHAGQAEQLLAKHGQV